MAVLEGAAPAGPRKQGSSTMKASAKTKIAKTALEGKL